MISSGATGRGAVGSLTMASVEGRRDYTVGRHRRQGTLLTAQERVQARSLHAFRFRGGHSTQRHDVNPEQRRSFTRHRPENVAALNAETAAPTAVRFLCSLSLRLAERRWPWRCNRARRRRRQPADQSSDWHRQDHERQDRVSLIGRHDGCRFDSGAWIVVPDERTHRR